MEEKENQPEGRLDSKVIPVMREAVATVQLVTFGQLKEKLAAKYRDLDQEEFSRLVGCLVSDLFGTPAHDNGTVEFTRQHQEEIEKELWGLKENLPDLLLSG